MIRRCKVCGSAFEAKTNFKCCSRECSRVNQLSRMKSWNAAHPERIAEFKRKYIESLRTA